MAIYDYEGNFIEFAYDSQGNDLQFAYDYEGNEVFAAIPDIPVEPLNWDMTNAYSNQIKSALSYIRANLNADSFAFVQFNDVHEVFSANEPNFIDYNKGYKLLSRMLFVGDMVNNATITTTPNAVAYMNGASASKKLVGIGNHEFYRIGATAPETEYKDAINATVFYMPSEVSNLAFYSDDLEKNVRYIMLDYFYVTRGGDNDDHLLDDAQLEWCASVMESAGTKDIIIAGHTMIGAYTNLVTQASETASALVKQQNLIDLINAFKNRTTYTVTVDGVNYVHDFSNCSGDFILYTSGHYHKLGHGNGDGFNTFTTPTLLSNATNGFVFFLINTSQKTVKMIRCSKTLNQYGTYDFDY